MRALLSDVLDVPRHGASLPLRGADVLLEQLGHELLPTGDTGFDLERERVVKRIAPRWREVTAWLQTDQHGRHHQWRIVESRHDDDGTITVTPTSTRTYDTVHDAKQALRRLRAELTRDHPDRKARGDHFDLEELRGTGRQIATPPTHP